MSVRQLTGPSAPAPSHPAMHPEMPTSHRLPIAALSICLSLPAALPAQSEADSKAPRKPTTARRVGKTAVENARALEEEKRLASEKERTWAAKEQTSGTGAFQLAGGATQDGETSKEDKKRAEDKKRSDARAAAASSRDRTKSLRGQRTRANSSKRTSPRSSRGTPPRSRTSSRDRAASAKKSAATRTAADRARASSKTTEKPTDKKAEKSQAAADEKKGFIASTLDWVRANAVWILSALGAGTLLVLGWAFLGGRRKGDHGEDFLESLDEELERPGRGLKKGRRGLKKRGPHRGVAVERFSSTKISAKDVNDRLAKGTVDGETVETNREYALVVDEEALNPELGSVDQKTGRGFNDESSIRELIGRRDYDAAYQVYVEHLEEDGSREFHDDVEETLGEYFLANREYDRAARVLEHHVATHSREDISPETYFTLGYLHFQTRTLNKSRRFFKLFVETEKNPERTQRARRILASLESVS